MKEKYNIQRLDISSGWKVLRNVFFDIDPTDNVPEDDKYFNIYCQEDLLYFRKDNYHLDLVWYVNDDLTNERTGYCIHLFRDDNWNKSELLEKLHSKNKQVIVKKINELIKEVDIGYFDDLTGYTVDENDDTNENDFNTIDNYSARQTE